MRSKMFRTLLAFLLTAGLLFSSVSMACEHYPGQVEYEELDQNGYVAPKVGVPGSTGTRLCPVCGAVCIAAEEIPALPEPAEVPATHDGEQPTDGANPSSDAEKPDVNPVPQEPPAGSGEQQENKEDTLPPVQPEMPAAEGAESSGQDVAPAAEQPAGGPSDAGLKPAPDPQPEQPAVILPEQSGQDAPVQPESPAEESAPVDPAAESRPAAAESAEPAEAEEQKAEAPESQPVPAPASAPSSTPVRQGTESGKDRSDAGKGGAFSFRRTHFHPEPGIWAEAAGELIWPVYPMPFQQDVKP